LVRYSRALHDRGWVANHDGNLSARLDSVRVLCTPTAVSKGDVCAEWLIVVDGNGELLQGTRKPFSELALHLAAYRARPEVGCVIHAHPPTATGFSVAGVELGHPFMAEPVVSLGRNIPTVAYDPSPKADTVQQGLAVALAEADAVLLERHGVLTVGESLEQAFLRMELVEHLARIALVAHQLGGVRALPGQDIEALAARGRPASVATGLEPHEGSPVKPTDGGGATGKAGSRPDLDALVNAAVRRHR
jgi:L-fuculose-phosphate aldolase